jgi:hypothetical protein
VQLLPGPVEAAALRPTDIQEPWRAAYFLPPLPARQEGASLVLPTGSFRPGRILELQDGGTVTLSRLLERGEDYERALYD